MRQTVYTNAMEQRDYDLYYGPEEPEVQYCEKCGKKMKWRTNWKTTDLEYQCEECLNEWTTN